MTILRSSVPCVCYSMDLARREKEIRNMITATPDYGLNRPDSCASEDLLAQTARAADGRAPAIAREDLRHLAFPIGRESEGHGGDLVGGAARCQGRNPAALQRTKPFRSMMPCQQFDSPWRIAPRRSTRQWLASRACPRGSMK